MKPADRHAFERWVSEAVEEVAADLIKPTLAEQLQAATETDKLLARMKAGNSGELRPQ